MVSGCNQFLARRMVFGVCTSKALRIEFDAAILDARKSIRGQREDVSSGPICLGATIHTVGRTARACSSGSRAAHIYISPQGPYRHMHIPSGSRAAHVYPPPPLTHRPGKGSPRTGRKNAWCSFRPGRNSLTPSRSCGMSVCVAGWLVLLMMGGCYSSSQAWDWSSCCCWRWW